jgi:protein-disulfide isomerase/copper chaperone CopZ
MKKTKFKIKGMHCNSCATLIEEKLNNKPGVARAKISHDSEKGVVVFDENQIKESDIYNTIKEAGDYETEKIAEEETINDDTAPVSKGNQRITSQKHPFLSGLLVGAIIVSIGLNLFFTITPKPSLKADIGTTSQKNNFPTNQYPSQLLPTAEPEKTIQTFTITSNDHIRGNINAPVTLVEFSDFECPFCERHAPTMEKILQDYPQKVRLVYKHFPLGFHPNAQKAAEASECASEQGKFWEYHDELFTNLNNGFSTEKFKQFAKDLGLNTSTFNSCLDSGKYTQKVQNDYQEGLTKGVNGTPATFINGQLTSGALPYESFKQIIDGL